MDHTARTPADLPPRAARRARTALVAVLALVGALTLVAALGVPRPAGRAGTWTPPAPAAVAVVGTVLNDFTGDGDADLLASSLSGTLYVYPGDGASGFGARTVVGTGWQNRDQIRLVGDFDGLGGTDVLARDPGTGQLWLYGGSGTGTVTSTVRIGTGWSMFRDVVAPGDWDGDHHPDVLAVRASDGALWLYPGDGAGGWRAPRQVGTGWLGRDAITPAGDWDGDGRADLLARDPATGRLWLYRGSGTGGFLGASVVGGGWGAFTALRGSGDWSGDGRPDVLARTCVGALVLYRGNGVGGFQPAPYPTVGTGWTPVVLTWPDLPVAPVPASLKGLDLTLLPTTSRVIALTFDGGASDAGLASIRSTLTSARVPGTFFLTGDFVRRYPVGTACLAAAGYRIGNHSNTHAHYPLLTDTQIRADLLAAERTITGVGARTARPLFRFPFGDRTTADIAVVNAAGYVPVRWTVDSLGWKGTEDGGTAQAVADRVVAAAVPGAIVLMHVGANPDDGTTFDADALPQVIRRLQDLGYRLVPVDELVH